MNDVDKNYPHVMSIYVPSKCYEVINKLFTS